MDIDKMVVAFEKYLREFILYLLSFFRRTTGEDREAVDFDIVSKSAVFAILSAVLGSYLWNRHIAVPQGLGDCIAGRIAVTLENQVRLEQCASLLKLRSQTFDLVGTAVDYLLRWLSYGVVLYLILRLLKQKVSILGATLSVLKVFAVGTILSIYIAYLVTNGCAVANKHDIFSCGSQDDYFAAHRAYQFQLLFVWWYMTREIIGFALPKEGKIPSGLAAFLFALFVTVAQIDRLLPDPRTEEVNHVAISSDVPRGIGDDRVVESADPITGR